MRTTLTRRVVITAPVITAAALAARPLLAASYPSRTITMIVPSGAGGGVDITARIIAPRLAEKLKQPVAVINKAGAGDIVGTQYASRAAPDGYTVLLGAVNMVINPAIYHNLPYDAARDFIPITELVTVPLFIVVKGDSPIQSIEELIAFTKAHPDKANYASGSGLFWLTTELFAQKTGLKLTRIPYRDASAMTIAVISGEVLFAIPGAGPVVGSAHAGAIRLLATTVSHRVSDFPDVPTLAEAGVAGMDVSGWHGLWAPAKTPPAIIKTLNQATREVLTLPEVRASLQKLNLIIVGNSTSDFERKINTELELWQDVAKKMQVTAKR